MQDGPLSPSEGSAEVCFCDSVASAGSELEGDLDNREPSGSGSSQPGHCKHLGLVGLCMGVPCAFGAAEQCP